MIDGHYQKRITAYVDGSMSPTERSEFEALIDVNPEFKEQIKAKEDEVERIKALIPKLTFSERTREELDQEIKQSVFTLLKTPSKNFWGTLKDRYEEWLANH